VVRVATRRQAAAREAEAEMSKRKDAIPADEQRVNLPMWPSNRVVASHDGQGRRLSQVSIGRTNSELGLGFVVSNPVGKVLATFVLDRAQVENVAMFMQLKVLYP
jgi:hypothetical protein